MMALFPTEQNSKWHKAGFQSSPSEVDGWRSPQKPEGPSGRRCEDWTRRKELLFPDAGIVVRDHKIPPDTRLAGSSPCLTNGVRRDQQLAVDFRALSIAHRRCCRHCLALASIVATNSPASAISGNSGVGAKPSSAGSRTASASASHPVAR